ncbi:MAG: DUF1906 domain-containing protein, partial [Pyrinomonadaceae bacterium]
DDGESWREVSFSSFHSRSIVDVKFLEDHLGWIVANESDLNKLILLKTEDGGVTWTESMLILPSMARAEVSPETVSLDMIDEWNGFLTVVLPSSSNFDRRAVYRTSDGGNTWEEFKITSQIRTEDGFPEKASGGWELRASGYCAASKTGCVQETRIFSQQKEITPAIIKTLAAKAREKARRETRETIFSVAPNGNTRVSLGRGFDKCTAATSSQMQTWWNESPFYDANIYLSGRNRGCSQPQLTAGWVETVSNQGWGLIPTVVGYQSPCSTCTSCAKHSSDAVTAEQQGRGEADIAIADANALGLTTGTVLYYDMERYNDTSGTGACSTPTKAFLKGWTERLHETGYVSGVYGSPTNAVEDWLSIPETSRMDAVWLARWDNIPSVWTYASPSPTVPDTVWQNHQRIKQWQAPHNETWGGVTFNIDGNIADAPVAAAAKPKNKTADFDGDGKTDVSVWRPDTSVWYIINSSNSTFHIQSFGLPTDILTPGDYDGDGKTDLAVWRPSEGIWHQYSRSIHTSFQFGSSGDIPVPADYDGDGRTDFAVYRPSTGVWYIKNSLDSRGTSYTILSFGLNGDKPVPGDYDGDGKADLAVWRPSDGNWYLLQSTQGFSAVHFGLDGDKPAQGDYDGDGKTDFGIFRNGVWYLLKSQEGLGVAQFGLAGDMPTTGDFDGDNKSDIAVFRPSNGTWYMLQSQSGFTAVQFGRDGDKPVPNAYLPE